MRLDSLLYARSNCIGTCPSLAPCSCPSTQSCVLINRTCDQCSYYSCISNTTSSGSSQGISAGALAGAIVGSLVLLAVVVGFIWWYRRRSLRKKAAAARSNEPKESPARAEDVLNRPDPNEKPEAGIYSLLVNSTSNFSNTGQVIIGQALGSPVHSSGESAQSNPFEDYHSIQTTSTTTQGTNVIPIALVTPGSLPNISSQNVSSANLNPARPNRSPELNLNLDHVNVSKEGLRSNTPGSGAGSQGAANRNSGLSSLSYSSDFLNEIPMIITPTRGTVRQVLGVVKAEVVQAPPSTPSSVSADNFKSSLMTRPPIRSPLAESSFGPTDVLKEAEEDEDIRTRPDPFADRETLSSNSPAFTETSEISPATEWSPQEPTLPWARRNDASRPSSWSTQSDSIIADIGSATRVQIGLSPIANSTQYSLGGSPAKGLHRMTSGRLVSSAVHRGGSGSDFDHQQEKSSIITQRSDKRASGGSILSTASTKADSILESFPFVPPSPISDRPARVAPRSPLAKQQYTNTAEENRSEPPVEKPSHRPFAMSIGSQISTLSAGLGSFPFQIETPTSAGPSTPSTSLSGRQRASLDTLALTRDLSSYPLGFDRELHDNYPVSK